jgi:hypothetical protein
MASTQTKQRRQTYDSPPSGFRINTDFDEIFYGRYANGGYQKIVRVLISYRRLYQHDGRTNFWGESYITTT